MTAGVDVWVLGHQGAADVQVPDLGDYSVTPIASDVGSVSLDYPRDGARFAALYALVKEDRPVEVEIRSDGTSSGALGGILLTASGDDIRPGAVWTFTGTTLEGVMRRARTPVLTDTAQGGTEKGETTLTGTPGVQVRTLMQRAQARGALLEVDHSSFTNTLDSNGQPWATTASVVLAPGRDYADILTNALHDNRLCEWEVRRAPVGSSYRYELRLYNPNTAGVDRTLPGPTQLTLEHGRDLEDAPNKHDVSGLGTHVTAAGKDGASSTAGNATAAARLGYRIEQFSSFGEVSDPGTLAAAASLSAEAAGAGETEHTHGLVLGPDRPFPGRDFGLHDWVLRGVGETPAREQVVRYSLTRQGREVRATVTLGGIIAARSVVLRRALDRLSNGSTVAGAAAPPPDTDDGKAPAVPAGLTATSTDYYDGGGTPVAQVSAAWLAVTTNADGTAIGDLSGYEVQFRYLPGQAGNPPADWETVGITTATVLRWSPVVQGRSAEVRVRAYDRYARNGEWSAAFPFTTATSSAVPPTPATPTARARAGVLLVTYNGRGSAGEAQPVGYLRTELHRDTVPNFTPHRPLTGGVLNEAASSTYRGDYRAGMTLADEVPTSTYGTTYYYRLVSVTASGVASAPSAHVAVLAQPAQDGELGGMSIGKLLAGIFNVVVGIGERLYAGDPAGPGWEGDPAGFRFYTGVGVARRAVLDFVASTGALALAGRLLAGMGIGAGPTIDVNPSLPAIDLYPDATTKRTRLRARSTARPDSTTAAGFEIETLNAAGATDGFSLSAWSTNLWMGMKNTASEWVGSRLVLQGLGGAWLYGKTDAYVNVSPSGDVFLVPASGREARSTEPMGSGGAGFSFKVQGLGNAGFRTAYDAQDNCIRFVDNAGGNWVSDGAGGRKSFVIPHPVDPDRWLVHVTTESPEALVEYHGEAVLRDGVAEVELPAYFERLCADEGRRVHVTMLLPDEPAAVEVPAPMPPGDLPGAQRPPTLLPEHQLVRPAAASTPRAGRFRVACPAPDGTRVGWRVVAPRRDQEFDVEPLRSSVLVHGDGPYRYLTDREE